MDLRIALLVLVLLPIRLQAADSSLPWDAEMAAGKRAFGSGQYSQATAIYRTALVKAEQNQAAPAAILPILHSLGTALRTEGKSADAEQILQRVLATETELNGESGTAVASAWSNLAIVQKAQDHNQQASASIAKAIQLRSSQRLITEEL